MDKLQIEDIRSAVRENYGKVAGSAVAGGCCSGSSCCGKPDDVSPEEISIALGYSGDNVMAVPEGANMGLGCGNPTAIAGLKPGEFVLDLGSGGGFDCFLAARAVGDTGQVIGVDMTPEMISKARGNAEKTGFQNVDFRLGELENLPIAGASLIPELESMMQKAGFRNIRIMPKYNSRDFIKDWVPGSRIEDYVVSAAIEAVKPEV